MIGRDLLSRTAELVAVPSVSHHESELATRVARELEAHDWLEVSRIDDTVVARTQLGRAQRLLVAGHLDTVPPAGNEGPRVDGETLFGVGSCDMKGGLAVMLELARESAEPAVDVTWCFYACEEVAREHNGLARAWEQRPDLFAADAAVLCEPTDARVEAGCQGTMRVELRLGGVRAHTARPYTGRNAVHRLAPLLTRIAGWEGRAVELDGCEFVEQLQAVGVSGGVASNVVPDLALLTVNHRFAPDRDARAAFDALEAVFDGLMAPDLGDGVEIVDAADGAPPALGHPLLAALVESSGTAPRAKAGWTDVATMWAHGVPAANFGPGDPLLAHRADEHVTRTSLERTHEVLGGLLRGGGAR